jgi:beta-mannan synthase
VQEISLNYHIRCEQFARHAAGVFFNFNGTAGAWRLTCVEDAGGWTPRTTVEDMDLSLRAYLRGWKFVFLDDVTCDCEIPAVYDAYRKQQHRWSCGPAQLFKIAASAVWRSEKTPLAKKMYLIVFFFGTRMFASHLVSFALYCTLIPICATFPEVVIPFWALVYVPLTITISTAFWTRGGWRFAIPYVLCENAMSVVKVTAMFSGFLDWADANEWVVTRKLGRIIARKVDDARRSKSRAVAFVATRLAETRKAKDAADLGEQKKKKRTGRSARWVFSSSRAPRTARSRTRCGSTPCSLPRRGWCSWRSGSTTWTGSETEASKAETETESLR